MSENQRGLVYLITGGSGFLGRHLLNVLLEKEDKLTEVRVFDKHVDSSLNGLGTGRTIAVLCCFMFEILNCILESANLKCYTVLAR